MTNEADLTNRFMYHSPTPDDILKHQRVRDMLHDISQEFNVLLPEGREKATAFTKLEEAMFWANAAIARFPNDWFNNREEKPAPEGVTYVGPNPSPVMYDANGNPIYVNVSSPSVASGGKTMTYLTPPEQKAAADSETPEQNPDVTP